MEMCIPNTRPSSSQKSRPPYMTARARLKEKKKSFRQWRRSNDGKDYILYAKARNQVKWECRRAEKEFERKIASEAKAFNKYARSKMKTRIQITNLTDKAGNLVTSDKYKANLVGFHKRGPHQHAQLRRKSLRPTSLRVRYHTRNG